MVLDHQGVQVYPSALYPQEVQLHQEAHYLQVVLEHT